MWRIEQDDQAFREAMQRIAKLGAAPRPLLAEVAEYLLDSTLRRFDTSTDPDGNHWAPNRPLTVERFLGMFKGSFKKDGSRSAKGAARAAAKKPLIGETRALSTQIHYILANDGFDLGSSRVQSRVMQQGAKARSFTGGRSPWGDIPARPFLGYSRDDTAAILDMARDYAENLAEGGAP